MGRNKGSIQSVCLLSRPDRRPRNRRVFHLDVGNGQEVVSQKDDWSCGQTKTPRLPPAGEKESGEPGHDHGQDSTHIVADDV